MDMGAARGIVVLVMLGFVAALGLAISSPAIFVYAVLALAGLFGYLVVYLMVSSALERRANRQSMAPEGSRGSA